MQLYGERSDTVHTRRCREFIYVVSEVKPAANLTLPNLENSPTVDLCRNYHSFQHYTTAGSWHQWRKSVAKVQYSEGPVAKNLSEPEETVTLGKTLSRKSEVLFLDKIEQ